MPRLSLLPLALPALLLAASLRAQEAQLPDAPAPPPVPAAEELIRQVLKSQKRAEERFDSFTFDQREERTKFGSDGKPKEKRTRLYYVLSSNDPESGSRELVEVDGRPATDEEKKDAEKEDAKNRKHRLEEKAAERASERPAVSGDDDDPAVGRRRLSDLMKRFDVRVVGQEVLDGRPAWLLEFEPRPGVEEHGLGDRALNALAGRAWIDARDMQVRRVEARLLRPVKVAGGLAANVKRADVVYEADPVVPGYWFPARIDLRLEGKQALFFRLDAAYRFTLSNFRTFAVETSSVVEGPVLPPVESPR